MDFNRSAHIFCKQVKHVEDLGADSDFGSKMLSLLGISTAVSRLVFGRIADSPKVNRLYVSQISALIIGSANILLPR